MINRPTSVTLQKTTSRQALGRIASGLCITVLSLAPARLVQAEELHTVAAIRELTVEQTQQKISVQIHGVVTFFDDFFFFRFIQDETASIYLAFPTNLVPPVLVPGQVVSVSGVAGPGEYAPVVLADNMGEGVATGSERRTAPLWSIGLTAGNSGGEAYLHDGRARSLEEAILWHGGEAEASKESFRTMSAVQRAALVKFLKSL
jgi:hypothetical protein